MQNEFGQDFVNDEEPVNEYVNVLDLLNNEQWIGSDDDVKAAIKLLEDVLNARSQEPGGRDWI